MNVVPATTPGIWPSISQNMYAMPSGLNRPISAAPVLRPNPAGMLFRPDSQFGNQYKPLLINNLPPTDKLMSSNDKLIPTDKLPVEKIIAIACAISAAVTIFVVIIFYYIAIADSVKLPLPPDTKTPLPPNNKPTYAIVYAMSTSPVTAFSNNSMVPSGWYFPFNNIMGLCDHITNTNTKYNNTNNSTIFTLAPNNLYKCSFALGGYAERTGSQLPQNIYGWYDITNGAPIGVFASYTNQTNSVTTGLAMVGPSPIKIGVMFSYVHPNGMTVTPYAGNQYGPLNSWAIIEMIVPVPPGLSELSS